MAWDGVERRRFVRRQADREVLQRLRQLEQHVQAAVHDGSASTEMAEEKRRLRRRAIRHNVAVHIATEVGFRSGVHDTWTVEDLPVKGKILDLSPTGCALFTTQMLDVGTNLKLIIQLQSGAKIAARGIVRWTKAIDARGGFASGVEFTAVSDKDRRMIDKFLQELDQTIGL